MKKKLLFVIPSLDAGGGEKSLINLLRILDFNRFDVDLMLFHKRGLFLDLLPKEVRVLTPGGNHNVFSLPLSKSILGFLSRLDFSGAWNRWKFYQINKQNGNKSVKEQRAWRYLGPSMPKLTGHYDTAIAFLEKTSIYYTVDKVDARQKIGFIHNDYKMLGMDASIDQPFFEKLDHLFTVSESCKVVLDEVFPQLSDKTSVMYNVVSASMLEKLAQAPLDIKHDGPLLVSVGRLHPQKGFDVAIVACKKLVDAGFNIKWIVLGEGPERQKLEQLVRENGLENHFLMPGLNANPYPYIKKADIYVQPSRFEGKSIAIDEAKILAKPIVVTNFSTVADQISNGFDGLVTDMDADSIATALQKVIEDADLCRKFEENLRSQKLTTESEVEKLYAALDRHEK